MHAATSASTFRIFCIKIVMKVHYYGFFLLLIFFYNGYSWLEYDFPQKTKITSTNMKIFLLVHQSIKDDRPKTQHASDTHPVTDERPLSTAHLVSTEIYTRKQTSIISMLKDNINESGSFICGICGFVCDGREDFAHHLISKHKEDLTDSDRLEGMCNNGSMDKNKNDVCNRQAFKNTTVGVVETEKIDFNTDCPTAEATDECVDTSGNKFTPSNRPKTKFFCNKIV